jgi:hypothetical protein
MKSAHVLTGALLVVAARLILSPAVAQEEPPALVEAQYDEDQMIWSLGEQTWEFADLATAYVPAKGTFNPTTREAVWTLQLAKDLTPGETGLQNVVAGSPFKALFLDEEKSQVVGDARIKITSITGRKGDSIRVTIRMPDEATLANVALIRLERRTDIGF